MSVKTFAAIDVGSFELTMKIFDFSGKNTMREIDCIRQRIDLGSDTYANGKISNEKMDDLCHTLKEFSQIMESYKVIAYKAYGTSAIRETENALILQDQIEQRTGIRVEILSNSEQRFLDYKSIASKGRRSAGSSRRRRRFWTLEAEVFRSPCLTRILWYLHRTYALVYYVYRSC